MAIDKGVHGETDLAGLNITAVFRWPGAINEGKGEWAAFVDERASEAQRNALPTLMVAAEKLLPFGRKVALGSGLVFSAWGAIMLLG